MSATTSEVTPSSGYQVVVSKKEKDPRRVEAGKRLALISKQAKEKKRIERDTPSNGFLIAALTGIGVVVAIVTLWYTRKEYLRSTSDPRGENKAVDHKEDHRVDHIVDSSRLRVACRPERDHGVDRKLDNL